jgi:hypothetical protein
MRKDILVNYILLYKIKPQLCIGWVSCPSTLGI